MKYGRSRGVGRLHSQRLPHLLARRVAGSGSGGLPLRTARPHDAAAAATWQPQRGVLDGRGSAAAVLRGEACDEEVAAATWRPAAAAPYCGGGRAGHATAIARRVAAAQRGCCWRCRGAGGLALHMQFVGRLLPDCGLCSGGRLLGLRGAAAAAKQPGEATGAAAAAALQGGIDLLAGLQRILLALLCTLRIQQGRAGGPVILWRQRSSHLQPWRPPVFKCGVRVGPPCTLPPASLRAGQLVARLAARPSDNNVAATACPGPRAGSGRPCWRCAYRCCCCRCPACDHAQLQRRQLLPQHLELQVALPAATAVGNWVGAEAAEADVAARGRRF